MILVCAATGTEAAACRRGIADAGAKGIEVLTTGVGPERAREALRRWLAGAARRGARSKGERPTLVVSSGFAGALTADVAPLAWVTASALYRLVQGGAVPLALPAGLLRVAEGATACHVISADHPLTRQVPGLGAPAAVDMESAALAEVAGEAGLPFLVLRLVTDAPDRRLAPIAQHLAGALAARGVVARAAEGARAALDAARAPAATAAFLRDALAWRDRLRAGWREQASRGVPASAVGDGGKR